MTMKKLKKMAAFGTALTMLVVTLAGCGSKGANANEESSSKPAETETQKATEKTEETAKATEKTEETAKVEFSYPMEGGKSVTIFSMRRDVYEKAGLEKISDSKFAAAATEATGIGVEYVHPSATSAKEAFTLYVTNGEYTDIMELNTSYYAGGVEALYEDGVIIPLKDVIDQYMPNVKAWMEANPKDAENFYSPDGEIYMLPYILETPEQAYTTGLHLRQDWLDELGFEVPTTLDDWHEVLTAFKESKGVIPYTTAGEYLTNGGGFGQAFVPEIGIIVNPETGKIAYGRALDAYREYLTLLHEWNEEGLIDPDAVSLDANTAKAKIASGEAGASWGWTSDMDYADIPLVAAPAPQKEAGAEHYSRPGNRVNVGWVGCITTQCEDVEAAARYLDYFYGEEGKMLANYGIEGESYEMVDGKPVFTDLVMKNPDGIAPGTVKANYTRVGGYPGFKTFESATGTLLTQAAKDSYEIWSAGEPDFRVINAVKPSLDQQERATEISTELDTYCKEMSAKFFLGTLDITDDAVWTEYVDTMKIMGVEELVEIYQNAYDAFYAKLN